MKRITINDVARRAGVSKSTVSHVLNNTRFVEDATKQKVLDAVEELGYRPSTIARSLISKKTKTVGLYISDVRNPFYSDVILGVEEVAIANGYNVFLCNSGYDLNKGLKLIQLLIDKLVDGVLFMSSGMSDEYLHELEAHHIPSVVMDWEASHVGKKTVTISINFDKGIREAIKHLVGLGHKRIVYVSGPANSETTINKHNSFLAAYEHFRLGSTSSITVESEINIKGGRSAFRKITNFKDMPTAILASNDLTALGIVWEAIDSGMKVPVDLSVIGFDNLAIASDITPSLTTISLPRFQIGTLAMKTLLGLINSPNESFLTYLKNNLVVDTNLVIRNSTAQSN